MMRIRRIHTLFPIAVSLYVLTAILSAQEEPADLTQARTIYQREVELATRPIRDRYLLKLESLKKMLGSRGDIRAALAVQEEFEKFANIGMTFERFAGVWKVAYNGGTLRTYSIAADGTFTFVEENGKRLTPPLVGKLRVRGADVTIEHEVDSLERLSISGGKLTLEHFRPKATYPAGPPANRGTGTKASAAKP